MVEERTRESDLQKADLAPTRSLLFIGPPGVGKTLAAKLLASRLRFPLVRLDLSTVMSSFLGRTGTNLKSVLDYARETLCVLLLDEFDAIAKRRDDVVEIGELKRLVNVLLQEIEDWSSQSLLIAATNHSALLDPAVWRRFDLLIEFPMPSPGDVRKAVQLFTGPDEIDAQWLDVLALAMQGTSFSEIEKEMQRMKREALILRVPVAESIKALVMRRVTSLPRNERKRFAGLLTQRGLSQRAIHDLTGVSRDTIRRHWSRSQR